MLNSEALADPAAASTGRIAPFGKYLLLQRVSVGGMAEIFKALPQDATRIDEIVAIKRILPNIAEDHEFIGMFIDEARIAGQLNHPNICRIYELGRVNNDHYIAMQFLWGRDLLKVMNRYKKAGRFVSASFAAWVGAKACSALHYAHTKCDEHGQPLRIIHRDVSPQNIIIGYSGHVKLIDFGVARAATQSQRTQAGILKGKFGYMSPEMIRGQPIDHRSDVFAMGICLHELLTSSRLFYGETDFATLELVRDAKVMPPSRKNGAVPPGLDAIVMRALSRDPERRYQSAEEMGTALRLFMSEYDPQFGQSDVGLLMRQAFQAEVQRERERLEIFWSMLERGELVRGAAVPESVAPPSETGPRAAPQREPELEQTEAMPALPVGEDDDLSEEQTQIFFSADELNELRELEHQERHKPAATLSDMIPPAPPRSEALEEEIPPAGRLPRRGSSYPPVASYDTPSRPGSHPPRPSTMPPRPPTRGSRPAGYGGRPGSQAPGVRRVGTNPPRAPFDPPAPYGVSEQLASLASTQRAGSYQQPGFPATHRSAPPPAEPAIRNPAFDGPSPFDPPIDERAVPRGSRSTDELLMAGEARARSTHKLARYAVFALLIVTLAVASYALPRFADAGTGALAVESVGDPDALVRVDGVVRGNPPLVVEGLLEGVHRVEVEATGFELARADVRVESGQSRSVKLTLEPTPTGAAPQQPTVERPPEITPLAVPPGKAAVPAPAKVAAPVKHRAAPPPEKPAPRAEEQSDEEESDAKPSSDEGEPTVQEASGSETQTGDDLNEELVAANEGELLISTVPWSHVFVDDEDTGRDTPVRSLRVSAGAHKIGLRTPDDVMHQVDVLVEPGKVVRIIRRF